jgi:hypothetical protein
MVEARPPSQVGIDWLSGEGRDEVPNCEPDARANRADDHHLEARAEQGKTGYLTLCHSDEEEG